MSSCLFTLSYLLFCRVSFTPQKKYTLLVDNIFTEYKSWLKELRPFLSNILANIFTMFITAFSVHYVSLRFFSSLFYVPTPSFLRPQLKNAPPSKHITLYPLRSARLRPPFAWPTTPLGYTFITHTRLATPLNTTLVSTSS